MKKKKLLMVVGGVGLLLVLAVLPFMAACAPKEVTPTPTPTPTAKPSYHWRLADVNAPDDPLTVSAYAFAAKLAETSNGRIVIDVYPAGELGDYVKNYEECGRGTLDFYVGCNAVNFDPRCLVEHMTYIAKDYDEAKRIFGKGGFMFNTISSLEEEFGIKIIDIFSSGIGGGVFTKVPPSPGDINVPKNMKVRMPPSKSWNKMAELFGYTAVSLPWSDVFSGLQTGVIEGTFGGSPASYYTGLRDVIKCYVGYNNYCDNSYYQMNLHLWNSLSAEDQQLIASAAASVCDGRFDICAKDDQAALTKMKDYGITVVTLTPEELQSCATACRTKAWPIDRDQIGAELYDKVVEYYGLK